MADVSVISGVWKVTSNNDKQKDSKVKTGKGAKKLLGELYADHEYLEEFVNDKGKEITLVFINHTLRFFPKSKWSSESVGR